MHTALLEDVQDCIDAMSQAVRECDTKEWTFDEMWLELEAQCQALARLSEAACDAEPHEDEDEDALGDDDEDVKEINFDDDETNSSQPFDDDDGFN